ncbi:HNH endonuclease signature motif containing protein [Nocardioides terrae]|uniref:HNH endonuclease signature motif containing protein n=1 Tax=Nocardioides terrae TaxID=574651 RepID=UPI00158782B1|nr:HNH endonuclease signature motif containing protein [Nocardioides terrae]
MLDTVDSDRVWSLSAVELGECLREAYAAQARLSELTLALLAQAGSSGLAAHDGAVSLPAWLREQVRLAPGVAKREVTLAGGLAERRLVREGLAAGAFPPASAAVVVSALDALPPEVDAEVVVRAEQHLVGEAHAHDTGVLRRVADHLDEVLDPDGADRRLAVQLARAEARAARRAFCRLRHDETTQTTDGMFRVPLVQGVRLQRMLEALLNPGRPDPIDPIDPGTGLRLSGEELRGRALAELVDRIPKGTLPRTGGCDPVVVVTMDLATLLGGLQAAHLDTGDAVSPGTARRLAARCGIIPAVLGSSSEVLDLGRRARFFTVKQRLAMTVQQGGVCAVEGCGRPAASADAHHLHQWRHGGRTDLKDGVLVCRPHHTYADHPDYRVERLRPGHIRLHRRQ